MSNRKRVAVDGERLWNNLMQMATIGATAGGGCNRLALTDDDKAARDLFINWCEQAGCRVRIDRMGNIFARRDGLQEDLPPVISGSHLDTQPTGGKFDGVYGVIAALEVIRALNDAEVKTRLPIEAVVWSNEEGARFSPAMIGSGVWAGVYDLAYAHSRADANGIRFGEALQRIGYFGDYPCLPPSVRAAFEAHIEQGPILDRSGDTIGIVSAIQGLHWLEIVIDGKSCHAGSTPMDSRQDPVTALGAIIEGLFQLAAAHAPLVRLTIGRISAEPGAYNTVPHRVTATVDLRHPNQELLTRLSARIEEIVQISCAKHRVMGSIKTALDCPPVTFDHECVSVVQHVADKLGYRSRRMISGAAHDSMHVAQVAPCGMIFVPCEDGLSHNPDERARPEDLQAGCNVLLHAMLHFAERI